MFAESKEYMHVKLEETKLREKLNKETELTNQLAKARAEFEEVLAKA